MNYALLKELAEQAGYKPLPGFDFANSLQEVFIKKFAELLVKECVSVVAKRKNQAIDDGWNVDEAMTMAEMDLKEHFGVEE